MRENNISFSVKWSGEGLHFSCVAAQHANHFGVGHRKVYNYRLNNVNSGLTHYNLQMGLNAFENIRIIKDTLYLDSEKLRTACDWHIWKYYGYILFLIIATDSKKENLALYKDCRRNLLIRLPSVLVKSKVSAKTKIRMVLEASAPVLMARRRLRREQFALQNDVME